MNKKEQNNPENIKQEEKNDFSIKNYNSQNNINEDKIYNNYLIFKEKGKEKIQDNISKENNAKIPDLLKIIKTKRNKILKLSKRILYNLKIISQII